MTTFTPPFAERCMLAEQVLVDLVLECNEKGTDPREVFTPDRLVAEVSKFIPPANMPAELGVMLTYVGDAMIRRGTRPR